MKYLPVCFALSLAIMGMLVGAPPSAFSKGAAVALWVALLCFGSRAKASIVPRSPIEECRPLEGDEFDAPLDKDLVATILDTLRIEPSEQLREMLAQSSTGRWSPEALQAARLLLDQRSNLVAPEPVYRTVPRTAQDQAWRDREAVAPGFPRHLLALDVGSRVYCGWRGEIGTITRWHDREERFYIRYESGEGEWTTLGTFE
jgi:hypothetical protein